VEIFQYSKQRKPFGNMRGHEIRKSDLLRKRLCLMWSRTYCTYFVHVTTRLPKSTILVDSVK